MPKVTEIKIDYRLGCSVQPQSFHSLSTSESGTFTVDISDTEGTLEEATVLYNEYRDVIMEIVDPPVLEFWKTKGGTAE